MSDTLDEDRFRTVSYQSTGKSLKGRLIAPKKADGNPGGVLLFPEWWGVDEYSLWRASEFADLGYTVFVADMYGDGVVTQDAAVAASLAADTRTGQLARTRANDALEMMGELSGIPPGRVVAVGYCFGGSVALELARSGASLAGVVACHAGLATPLPAGGGELSPSILVMHGDADPLVSEDELEAFRQEMRDAAADWQMVFYGHAQHSFTRPDADAAGMDGVAHHPRSEARSWVAVRNFLREVLDLPEGGAPPDM